MRMEFVVVSYPFVRDVRIDGQLAGKTNDTLRVGRGHHTFDLGYPQDYQPESIEKSIRNTTTIRTMHIDDFRPAGGDE
jgi:hypothetical protein